MLPCLDPLNLIGLFALVLAIAAHVRLNQKQPPRT